MAILYHAIVQNIGQYFPDGHVELMLDVERNNIHAWSTLFVDERTLKEEGIEKGSHLLINLSKKLKY